MLGVCAVKEVPKFCAVSFAITESHKPEVSLTCRQAARLVKENKPKMLPQLYRSWKTEPLQSF